MKTEMQILEHLQAQQKAKEEQFKFEHLSAQQLDQWKKQQQALHHQQQQQQQPPPPQQPQQMQHHQDVQQVMENGWSNSCVGSFLIIKK